MHFRLFNAWSIEVMLPVHCTEHYDPSIFNSILFGLGWRKCTHTYMDSCKRGWMTVHIFKKLKSKYLIWFWILLSWRVAINCVFICAPLLPNRFDCTKTYSSNSSSSQEYWANVNDESISHQITMQSNAIERRLSAFDLPNPIDSNRLPTHCVNCCLY